MSNNDRQTVSRNPSPVNVDHAQKVKYAEYGNEKGISGLTKKENTLECHTGHTH